MIAILHIETSTKICSVALSVDGHLKTIIESDTDKYDHAENVTLYIQDVLKRSSLELKDLSAVSVTSGPGSYTGLRIGVSTAKGLCYALSIPLISVDSLLSMSYLAQQKHQGVNLVALIDARRMEVFNGTYDQNLLPLKNISADIIDENSYKEYEPFVFFGDGAAKVAPIWEGRDCLVDLSIKASAAGQVYFAHEKYQKKEFEDTAYFEPFYLKDFVSSVKKSS